MKPKLILLTFFLLLLTFTLSACTGGGLVASSWPGVIVDQETAYVAYNQYIHAVQLANGQEKWHFPPEDKSRLQFYATPALSPDGQLLVAGYNKVLYSLNPQNGSKNWEFANAQNRYISGPLATEKGIFSPNADNNTYAVDKNGLFLWKYSTQDELWAHPISDKNCECIYLASMDHTIYAIKSEDGSLLWQSEDLGGSIVGAPALSEDGILYVGTFGSEMLALNAQDGRVLWREPTEGWIWSGPALAGDRLYVGDLKGNFYALNVANGKKIWQITHDKLDGQIAGSPLVLEERIYFTTESGSLYAVDTAGNVILNQPIGGKLFSSPVAAGDLILLAPVRPEEFLVAVNRDGVKQWSFPPPKESK